MTNEEAIKNLKAHMYYELDELPKDVGNAITVAIIALREVDRLQSELGRLTKERDAVKREGEAAIIKKESFKCENCKHLSESEITNRLWCTYHTDGEIQYETYKDDYCSYFERRDNNG